MEAQDQQETIHDDINHFLNQLTHGAMLVRIKSRDEKNQEITEIEKSTGLDQLEAQARIIPFEPIYMND